MSLQSAMAYDAERVVCNLDDCAEVVSLVAPQMGLPLRPAATWGLVEKDTERMGLVAHWCDVFVPTASLAAFGEVFSVRRNDKATLTRYPDDVANAQEWQIAAVGEVDGLTRFDCFTLARPGGAKGTR